MSSERIYVGRRRQMSARDWQALGVAEPEAERYAYLDDATSDVVLADGEGVRPLRHFVRHSPTGFEWAYLGSDPSDLARCMPLDHYGIEPPEEPWAEDGLQVSYVAFKEDVTPRLPRQGPGGREPTTSGGGRRRRWQRGSDERPGRR